MKVFLLCMAFAAVSLAMPVAEEPKIPAEELTLKENKPLALAAIEDKKPESAAEADKAPAVEAITALADPKPEALPEIKPEAVPEIKPDVVPEPKSAVPEVEKAEVAKDEKPAEKAVVAEIPNGQVKSVPETDIDMNNLNSDAALAGPSDEPIIISSLEKKIDIIPKAEPTAEEKIEEPAPVAAEEKSAEPKADEKIDNSQRVIRDALAESGPEEPKEEAAAKVNIIKEEQKSKDKETDLKQSNESDTKPKEISPVEAAVAEDVLKQVEEKSESSDIPVAGQTVQPKKPEEPKPTEPKPEELKPAEPKPEELKPAEPKPAEPKPEEPTLILSNAKPGQQNLSDEKKPIKKEPLSDQPKSSEEESSEEDSNESNSKEKSD